MDHPARFFFKLFSCFPVFCVLRPFIHKAKVTEKEACSICQAFWDEFAPLMRKDSSPQSSHFVSEAARLARTGHEERFSDTFHKYGLSSNIPISYVDVGLRAHHPVLCVADTVKTLALHDKLDLLMMGNDEKNFANFWSQWKMIQPKHPIFRIHCNDINRCIPIAIHCDEGTTLKKKSIMVIHIQSILGKGTRKRKTSGMEAGVNMLGNSLVSRFLWTVMLGRVYGGKRQNKPLLQLMGHLAEELKIAFHEGILITSGDQTKRWFLTPIAMKGDWPALAKIGQLTRTFGHQSDKNDEKAKGICHLCRADQQGLKHWNDISFETMIEMRANNTLPWKKDPCLVTAVGLHDSDKADFFRIDVFHTLHKGFFGDIAANGIATAMLFSVHLFCLGTFCLKYMFDSPDYSKIV